MLASTAEPKRVLRGGLRIPKNRNFSMKAQIISPKIRLNFWKRKFLKGKVKNSFPDQKKLEELRDLCLNRPGLKL